MCTDLPTFDSVFPFFSPQMVLQEGNHLKILTLTLKRFASCIFFTWQPQMHKCAKKMFLRSLDKKFIFLVPAVVPAFF